MTLEDLFPGIVKHPAIRPGSGTPADQAALVRVTS
jgi:hypothetical protein